MKLPSYRELSKEQDKIYNLPLSENYLVSGPPGTGKTVIALYRASMYKQQTKKPILLSYSKLLSNYTSDAAGELDIAGQVQTYHSWVFQTYRKHFEKRPPIIKPFVYDWDAITPQLVTKVMVEKPYLLVDEGQDLPPGFYTAASMMSQNLTVFADENQRITETQSSLGQIKSHARIKNEHKLTRNYRNTQEIAKVAACYYAGLPTGKPELPERRGNLPVIQNTNNLNDAINFISRFENLNSHMQIGVFTKKLDTQEILRNRFYGKTKNAVQFYKSNNDQLPSFKTPGIKLINYKSAKGLEFDAVFIPEIQALNLDPTLPETKMSFYVLLSRAREQLYLLYSGEGKPEILNGIPNDLVEFR